MSRFLSQCFTVQERKRSTFASDIAFLDYHAFERWRVAQNLVLGSAATGIALGGLLMWALMKGVQ